MGMDSIERQFYIENRNIGKGVVYHDNAHNKGIIDNNISLFSNHPTSPFKGESYKWGSMRFSDGTIYEGLTLENVPHNKGTFVLGNLSVAGLSNTRNNDRYEGEVHCGMAHGLGIYLSPSKNSVYIGEFNFGNMEGCGIEYSYNQFNNLIQKGFNYKKAWKLSKKAVSNSLRYGIYYNGDLIRSTKRLRNGSTQYCSINEIRGMLSEIKSVITKVRMFQFKPNTLVYNNNRIKNFTLLDTQDPIHYSFNTTFLMPGPLGQLFSIPNDIGIRIQLLKTAINSNFIHNQYNIPF